MKKNHFATTVKLVVLASAIAVPMLRAKASTAEPEFARGQGVRIHCLVERPQKPRYA